MLRSLASLSWLTASVLLLTGCPSPGEAPPALDPGGPADMAGGDMRDSGAMRDSGTMPDSGDGTVPFASIFAFDGRMRCSSQGPTRMTAELAPPRYQFSDCTVALRRLDGASGPVSVRADGWSGSATVDGERVQLTLHRPHDTFDFAWDWRDAPLAVALGITSAAGTPATTALTLTPAPLSDIVHFDAPTAAAPHWLSIGRDPSWPARLISTRRDASGTPVYRRGETVQLGISFRLAEGVSASSIFVEPRLRDTTIDQPQCVFDGWLADPDPGALERGTDEWQRPDGSSWLPLGDRPGRDCFGFGPARVEGTLAVRLAPSLPEISAPFALRIVAQDHLAHAVALDFARGEDGTPTAVTVRNQADYSLQPLAIRVGFVCEGFTGPGPQATAYVDSPADGFRQRGPEPGEETRFAMSDVAAHLDVSARDLQCAAQRWTADRIVVLEADGDAVLLPVTPFTISARPR
jgi:hypothetical protein